MILLALKLAMGGVGRLLSAAWQWATRNPLLALCVVLAGISAWFYHENGKHIAERDKARTEYAAFRVAVEKAAGEALAKQQAVNDAKQKEYVDAADHAQDSYDSLRALYVERMRSNRGSAPGAAATPAESGDSGLPPVSPAPAQYILSADDALKLPGLQAYANACFDWAGKLAAANAKPAP